MQRFWSFVGGGIIDRQNLQEFLDNPNRWSKNETELRKLISACSFVDVHEDITNNNFPLEEDLNDYDYTLEVISFDAPTESTEVLNEITKRGLKPASLRDLLRYCASNSDAGVDYDLAVLGCPSKDSETRWVVPVVIGDKNLSLYWLESMWSRGFRFLVRRPKKGIETTPEKELPTEMTICGRTYEILKILKDGKKPVDGATLVACAIETQSSLGEDDGIHLLAYQEDIPVELRDNVNFVFTDWRHPDYPNKVCYVSWYKYLWDKDWALLEGLFYGPCRLLRRKETADAE